MCSVKSSTYYNVAVWFAVRIRIWIVIRIRQCKKAIIGKNMKRTTQDFLSLRDNWCIAKFQYKFANLFRVTRMHSSRMRTGRSLTVCRSLLLRGGGLDLIPLNFPLGCGLDLIPLNFPLGFWPPNQKATFNQKATKPEGYNRRPPCLPGADTPLEQTPLQSRHPLESRHPLGADTPWSRHAPGADTPQSRHPPLEQTPPWEQTPPRSRQPPRSRYPQWADDLPPTADTLFEQTPLRAETPPQSRHPTSEQVPPWVQNHRHR